MSDCQQKWGSFINLSTELLGKSTKKPTVSLEKLSLEYVFYINDSTKFYILNNTHHSY
jgi:hypothetical protein